MKDKSHAGRRRRRNTAIIIALALLFAGQLDPAIAGDEADTPSGAGLQAVSWLATVPYGAVKLVYAVGGGVVGGLAWLMTAGNMDIAKAIWEPTMTGHYIVEPKNLTGEKSLHFMGGPSDYTSPASPETTP